MLKTTERVMVAWHVTVWDAGTAPRRLRLTSESDARACAASAEAAGFKVTVELVAVCH